MTPTISTTNLVLRPMKKVASRTISWLRDPDVVKYSEQRHQQHNLSTELRYTESFTGKSYYWGIHTLVSDEHIGNMTAAHDEPNNVTDLGIMIGEVTSWGKGYGAEAWGAVCIHLLNDGVRKLEAGCMKSNLAMVKIMEKTGFKLEGERANHFLLNGGGMGLVMYGRAR
jgi:ribosomal-protein-alanine N-acetyltransferase